MILCLDVGNSHIFGGIFAEDSDEILLRFRHNTNKGYTSDQLGVFLKTVLRENNFDCINIKAIAIASVVPFIDYSLHAACKKYFNLEPFVLRAGVKTGIKIKTANPNESGADIIAGCIAATKIYPHENLLIVDLGTATTLAAISAEKEFLGGAILPGLRISMDALHSNTAKLFPVEIIKPEKVTGRFTAEAIQSGLFYGHLGAIKEISNQIKHELFFNKSSLIIGTGGFSRLFETEKIFDAIQPDLVLHGIKIALELNK